jgi:hypothetical protein
VSRLHINARVYRDDSAIQWATCQWIALCTNPANGLRDAGPLGRVPICQQSDDKMERIGGGAR